MTGEQAPWGDQNEELLGQMAQDAADRWWKSNPDGFEGLTEGRDLWLLSVADTRGEKMNSSCLGFPSKDLPENVLAQGREIVEKTAAERGIDPSLLCAGILVETTKDASRTSGELPLLAAIYLLPEEYLELLNKPLGDKEFQVLQFLIDSTGIRFTVGSFDKYDESRSDG